MKNTSLLFLLLILSGCTKSSSEILSNMKSPVIVISAGGLNGVYVDYYILVVDKSGKVEKFGGAEFMSLKAGDTLK